MADREKFLQKVTAMVLQLVKGFSRNEVRDLMVSLESIAESLPDEDNQEDQEQPKQIISIKEEYRRCGKGKCKCQSGKQEDLHGPYLYQHFREKGKLISKYVGKKK